MRVQGRSGGRPGPAQSASARTVSRGGAALKPGPAQSRPQPLAPPRTTAPTTDARDSPVTASGSARSRGPGHSSARLLHCRGLGAVLPRVSGATPWWHRSRRWRWSPARTPGAAPAAAAGRPGLLGQQPREQREPMHAPRPSPGVPGGPCAGMQGRGR